MPTAPKLNGTLRAFIERQPLFFVATAAPDGRVNVSPKGMDSLRVVSETHIRWLNVSGSGNETAAHVAVSPRMTLMFCAFEGDALILRTYGTAKITHWHDPEWNDAAAGFPHMAGARQVFDLTIDLVQTSCGTGVPLMELQQQRGPEELLPFYAEMGEDGVKDYWRRKNTTSIDGAATGVLPE